MIAVPAYHLTGIPMYQLCELRIFIPILPSRSSHNNKQPHFVASIHECRILRIMSYTDNGTSCITQAFGIPPLLAVGQRITHVCKILMTVRADQLTKRLAIQPKAILTFKFRFADPHTCHSPIQHFMSGFDTRLYPIQIRRVRRP